MNVLRDGLFWVAVACCLVASLAILRATAAASGEAQVEGRSGRRIEIAYAVVPAIVLALVLVATWKRIRYDRDIVHTITIPASDTAPLSR